MVRSNYHTHTFFCDGIEAPEEYALAAIKNNMHSLGYSAHAPVPFPCEWPLPIERLEEYIATIRGLKEKYSQKLEIYNGLEIDYIPNLWPEMKGIIKPERFDFTIGSIHFIDTYKDGTPWTIDGNNEDFVHGLNVIFNNNSHEVFRRYFAYTREMVRVMKPTIVGHIDKLKMQYYNSALNPAEDKVYQHEFMNTLEEIAATNCIVEINTRGIYRRNEKEYYPGLWAMRAMADLKIKVTVNSDSHRPTELINHWNEAHTMLKEAGFKSVQVLKKGKWEEQEITL
jgi:histidinol-phosphatase (PHP family)